ncbi:Signal transduction histidine kinase [Nonomuraea maritima]|uniref:histidine kinase n=1 Tax=Nonomuraea maritima TaxID=683260 RepID=A0A1G9IN10_9ACTN|nr:HAMP domain-containing sensor histidine kinase [Nonomuraea maritima]SDL26527.1 Signal transduction histidine kinase [Nonomuraea maritima]
MIVIRRISLAMRITLFAGAMAVVLSALLAAVIMLVIHRLSTDALTARIRNASARVVATVQHEEQLEFRDAEALEVQVVDRRGLVVASTAVLRDKPRMARFVPSQKHNLTTTVCDGVFGAGSCHIVVGQVAHRTGEDWTVYVASPRIPWWVTPWLVAVVGGSAAVLAAAVTFLGRRIATVSLRPVAAILRELDEINATCPQGRVPVPAGSDEIHDLASTINETLTRLQGAMEHQRRCISDISHDLRNPITAMRAEMEDAMLAVPDTMTRAGNAVLCSLDRLEEIVCDLLLIAKLDGDTFCVKAPVDLAEMADAECVMHRHATKKLICDSEPDVVVLGDRLHLCRLLTNLLANAERHAEEEIKIAVSHEESCDRDRFPHGVAVLEVTDDGQGIAPDKRELVFQRFARLDAARDKDAGGTGLGLAIARQIAEAHGGTLRIEDSDRGARFVLRLPRHR